MQTTLAFAPELEDFDDIILEAPVIFQPPSDPDDEESEPGEP